MSGENNLVAKDKLTVAMTLLDSYEKTIGLPQLTIPVLENELSGYLTMDKTVIEKLSIQECKAIAYRLNQYAYYLQRTYNLEQSRVMWAENELNGIIAQHNNDYDKYMKFDIKVSSIIKENSYALSVYQILNYAKQRAIRITFLSTSLKNLADVLLKGTQHG